MNIDWAHLVLRFVSTAASVGTFFSVAILYLNYRAQRRTAKATLINHMDDEFSTKYSRAIRAMRHHPKLAEDAEYEDVIGDILQFWEKVSLLIETNSIDISTLDDMFSYRFFLFIQNPYIQDKFIYGELAEATGDRACDHYGLLFYLYSMWIMYREKAGKKPLGGRGLDEKYPEDYRRVLGKHMQCNKYRGLATSGLELDMPPQVLKI